MAVVNVKGLRELELLAAAGGPALKRELIHGLRAVAEPVRRDAEAYAVAGIRNIGQPWSRMRVGVTQRLVYVAPKERGVKVRGVDPRRRPNLAGLIEERAFVPALNKNRFAIEGHVEELLGRFAADWNRR